MTTSSRRFASLLAAPLVALSLLVTSAAGAQQPSEPSASDLESARELYKEGKELRQKGDLRGALERFKAAHGYGQTPVTGLELGKTHLQLGELVEAREVLLSIGRLKVASDETEKSASARTEAADLAEQIRPRIPTLVVKVNGVKPDVTPQVTVDGTVTPSIGLSSMRKINPGEHGVVVRAAGREEKRSVTLAESETKEVSIAITDASPKVGGDGSSAPGQDSAVQARGRSIHTLTWVGLGVGVVGIATGSIAGVLALGKASNVKNACSGLSCPPGSKKDVNDGRTDATISTIAFAVGVAGLGAAAVGYFVLSPSAKDRAALAPRRGVRLAVTPTWAGVDGVF
jgi:hypothetical protein